MHRRTDRPRHQIAFILILQVGWPLNAVMNVYRNKMLMPGKVIHAQPSAKASVSIFTLYNTNQTTTTTKAGA